MPAHDVLGRSAGAQVSAVRSARDGTPARGAAGGAPNLAGLTTAHREFSLFFLVSVSDPDSD